MKLVLLAFYIGLSLANSKIYNSNFHPRQIDSYLKSGYFKGFFTSKEFWDFYSDLLQEAQFKKILSDKIQIGSSFNNNPIYGFYICDDVNQLDTYIKSKNIIMFTGLHHSREPLTITMIMFMVMEIVKDFTQPHHSKMKELLRDNIIFFVPTLNIDSYLYITTMFRQGRATEDVLMIRKNRNIASTCNTYTGGVDLNRNYDYKFGLDNTGSSFDPCAEDYRGPKPFSEKETQAIKKFVDEHKNIVSCVNIHSYGNAWIYPFNYVHDGSDHFLAMKEPLFYDFYKEFEKEMHDKGRKAHFGNSAFVLDYPSNGEAGDWFTGAKHILNLDVELGNTDQRSDQFYPPRELIPRIVRYNWITMIDYLEKHVIILDLENIYVERGGRHKVIFEIVNRAIANLKDVVMEVKPLFFNNENVNFSAEWGVKALPHEVPTKFGVRGNQLQLTFRGRHILEIDITLDSDADAMKMAGLELIIKRNEGNYLYYPDQRYVFKMHHEDNMNQ